jgi:hypothetical protein
VAEKSQNYPPPLSMQPEYLLYKNVGCAGIIIKSKLKMAFLLENP